jgi:hypothetical protein
MCSMQPATLSYRSLDGTTDAILTSPEFAARLLSTGRPEIDVRFDGDRITFRCDTADFMLRSRVTMLFEDTLGERWKDHVANC